MLSLLRQHPGTIAAADAGYQRQLCSLLGVSTPGGTAQPTSSTVLPAAATEVTAGAAVQAAGGDADTTSHADTAAADLLPQSAEPVSAGGVQFKLQLDMFSQYVGQPVIAAVATAEQAASDAARAVAKGKADAAAAIVKAAAEAAAAEAAAAEAAAAAAAAAEAKASKGGKDPKGKPAAAAKPKEPSSAADKDGKAGKKGGASDKAAADAAAATEPVQPEFQFDFGGVKVPCDRNGAALCLEDAVPEGAIRLALQALQTHFLADMVSFCEDAESSSHSWAGEEEVAATEQLEARLRLHR